MTYAYSYDEEAWHGCFATRKAALSAARNVTDGGTLTIWTGVTITAAEYLERMTLDHAVRHLVESVDESLCETMASDNPIIKITSKQIDDLAKIVREWIRNNVEMTWFAVDDIREHEPKEAKP